MICGEQHLKMEVKAHCHTMGQGMTYDLSRVIPGKNWQTYRGSVNSVPSRLSRKTGPLNRKWRWGSLMVLTARILPLLTGNDGSIAKGVWAVMLLFCDRDSRIKGGPLLMLGGPGDLWENGQGVVLVRAIFLSNPWYQLGCVHTDVRPLYEDFYKKKNNGHCFWPMMIEPYKAVRIMLDFLVGPEVEVWA